MFHSQKDSPTTIRLAGLAMLLVGLAACNPANDGPRDTTGGAPGASGDIVKKNEGIAGNLTSNPEETRKYLMSLGWGDNLPDTNVVEAVYEANGERTRIRVVPNVDAHVISWQSALGMGTTAGNGYLVAKIYNLEDRPSKAFGLRGLGTGYVWVGSMPDGTRGVAVYTIKNNGEIDGTPAKLRFTGYCEEPHTDAKVMLTTGKKCPAVANQAASLGAGQGNYFFASQPGQVDPGPGLWIRCSGGCCETNPE